MPLTFYGKEVVTGRLFPVGPLASALHGLYLDRGLNFRTVCTRLADRVEGIAQAVVQRADTPLGMLDVRFFMKNGVYFFFLNDVLTRVSAVSSAFASSALKRPETSEVVMDLIGWLRNRGVIDPARR